jgi:hypothetical protein
MPGNPEVIRDDSEVDGLASWKTTEVCQLGHVLQSLRIGKEADGGGDEIPRPSAVVNAAPSFT